MSPAKKKAAKSRPTKDATEKKHPAKKAKPSAEKKKSANTKVKAEKKKSAPKAKPAKGALDRAKETVKKGVAAIAKTMKAAPAKPAPEKKKAAGAKPKAEKPVKKEKAPAAAATRKKPANVRAATPIQTTQFGNKYICFACQAKFYDLNRPEPICPKCGADQNLMPKEDIKLPKKPAEKKPRAMSTFYDDDEVASEEVDASGKDANLGFEDEFLDDMADEEVVEEEEEL